MMGGIWVMLFSHLHVHVCRDITGIIAVLCGLGRPQHELIQHSPAVQHCEEDKQDSCQAH